MRKIIIKIKDRKIVDENGRELLGLNSFVLEHNATEVTLDFSNMGVDDWEKCVDFETSNGRKLQYRYGNNVKAVFTLPTDVLEAGNLKLNPFAVRANNDEGYDRVSGNIFVIGVGEIVDAFEAGPPNTGGDSFSEIKNRLDDFKESGEPIEEYVDRFALKVEVYTKTEVDTITSDIYGEIIDVKDLAEGNKLILDNLTDNIIPGLELTKADRTELLLKADKATTYTKTEVDSLIDGVEVDLSGYYTKGETDSALGLKADKSNTYTKTEVNTLVEGVEVDLSGYYTKGEVDNKVNLKADKSNTYTKVEIDQKLDDIVGGDIDLSNYYNKQETYSKSEVDGKISNITVGGRNWFDRKNVTSWVLPVGGSSVGSVSVDSEDGYKYTKGTLIKSNGTYRFRYTFFSKISEKAVYTFSFWYKTNKESRVSISVNDIDIGSIVENSSTDWKFFSWSGEVYMYLRTLGFVQFDSIVDSEFVISDVKFEKGDIATDWTPAPEDLAYKVDTYTKAEVDTLIDGVEVDLSGYYTKVETDSSLGLKADKTSTYTKTEVDSLIDGVEVDLTDYYKKTEVDTKLNLKADKTYVDVEINRIDDELEDLETGKADKTYVDTELNKKSDKTYVDNLIEQIADYVIDFGSNANGSWEKWASGKLVCRGVFTATNGTTQSIAGIFRSASTQAQSYAMDFIEAPELELKSQSFSAMDAMINSIAYGSFSFRLLHYVNQAVDTPVLYIAVGRWK